jgi:hypothetical protein
MLILSIIEVFPFASSSKARLLEIINAELSMF